MESEFSPDQEKGVPPVPIKTYQWEDLRRAREAGGYPWTHLLKVPLEGEITAEDIIRETTPRRSMSREVSRSRTRSPVDQDVQRILNLDSSPGSSRRHGDEGEDEGVHIPNFSKEVSLDAEDDPTVDASAKQPVSQASGHLVTPIEIPKNVSPKGILKRRVPEQQYSIGVTETRERTKCCHPLVNKIKHLADKTLNKLERIENDKSPLSKRKKNEDNHEIRQLKSSPGAVRRQKFSAIKLGDSDEMSKTMSIETPPPRKKKEHIYEDIEDSKEQTMDKNLHFSPEVDMKVKNVEDDNKYNNNKDNESLSNIEKKSIASQDPSLVSEETQLRSEDHVMEKLHKMDNLKNESVHLDDEMDPEEPNVDEIFKNQLSEREPNDESPNITITEITDDDGELHADQHHAPPIESSPSPSPYDGENHNGVELARGQWSKPSSDHEYEIIEKPPPNVYTIPSVDKKSTMFKTDDELSSTTSLERKYLQHASDEEEPGYDKENLPENEGIMSAEALQKNIEDRYFANTPSTVSRTECEVSTSQVDSSALEQLPLKRESRTKNAEGTESKIQKRIKEGTGKLKTQAGKLKTKLQNMKANKLSMPERPKISLPDRPKFKMPERPKITLPDRPKFSLPDRRKFSLPDRPKFKKINISEKLNFGDRKKFTMPERPRFNVPEMPKFRMPERPKINFPSLGRKNKVHNEEYKVETTATGSSTELGNIATVDFEARTYPRWFSKKKKTELPKTSSSPTLNREETPPPTFKFTRVSKKSTEGASTFIPDSPEEPREYGNASTRTASNDDINYDEYNNRERRKQFETTYDFDAVSPEYMDDPEPDHHQNSSDPDISPSKKDHTPVITEINNDEFFVRPRGISREDIQVREYLSDETRQAFKTPKNVLALMGSSSEMNDDIMYMNDPEGEPEFIDENEQMRYSTEDLNDKDDGYYTFPPVRPSRAKRKKKPLPEVEPEPPYIDESADPSMEFTDVELRMQEINIQHADMLHDHEEPHEFMNGDSLHFTPTTDLHSIHEYANDDVIQYPENVPIQSQTLPMPPRRKKRFDKQDLHSSLSDFKRPVEDLWEEPRERDHADDLIVYRTEHEYIVPRDMTSTNAIQGSPVPPRRTRSRSSRATSLCDDDRTSHGADSLTLDSHIPPAYETSSHRDIRHESPGYATVDKGPYAPPKGIRRSISKTPPVRRRKSNSSERKYYTVGSTKNGMPDRPPRKKSSTSLMTLDSFTKHSDITQYVEIDDEPFEEIHKDLNSGDVVSKMKDRPLPPPPRPPRGSRKKKKDRNMDDTICFQSDYLTDLSQAYPQEPVKSEEVVEIEVSTQTDPLPDDVEFELGLDENLDVSMSSSLRDIVDEESMLARSYSRIDDSPRISRPTSRSEKSVKLSDPKITELSKPNLGRSSPTVILVERRVSSPTRINERQEMLTEASLTVQHIDIDESQIPDVPPLPRPRGISNTVHKSKNIAPSSDERALERMTDASRDVHLDNLVTQRLQVRDLDVGRLNVSELQANKILVSNIEGMTLQVSELDSKSGHISVSGIDFSQNVIDEIVKKFAEISTHAVPLAPAAASGPAQESSTQAAPKPVSIEEETQTEQAESVEAKKEVLSIVEERATKPTSASPRPDPPSPPVDDTAPQRPPPPDLTPLLYSYLQDITIPPAQFYPPRQYREPRITDIHEPQQTPPPPTRRVKRKPVPHQTESSSDEARLRPSPRRMPPPVRAHEPTVVEAGTQFLRVCHSSISRTLRSMFSAFMSYISGTEDKRDAQMALVIFLVLVAGLIMLGLSDSRAIHHHHWEFFNPPDSKQ